MLEGLVAGLLNRFLGMYVKNFDPTQLKVGIWSGDVKLRNLKLRREALDQLKLPVNVIEGHVGDLTLVIPWSNLRGAPVKVFVEDVFLLASPKEEAEYDEEEEERRKQRLKREKLDSAELLKERNQAGMSPEEVKKNQSFTQSLVTKIVDNLQVTVKNIHIRYEDSISAPGHPFALGLTLEEFSAVSTDGEWKPTFIQDSSDTTNKLATLGALAVYWNTDSELFGTGREAASPDDTMPYEEMIAEFKKMIKNGGDSGPSHQFILKPVNGQAKIELDKTGSTHIPKFKANLLFEEIGLVLDDDQYRDGLMMVDLFHYFIRHQEYKKLQPKGVTPKEDPRAWFLFAGNAVLGKIHERNRRWTWDYFKERRDDRKRYIELFKKNKQQQQLTAEENEDLRKLEWKLSYEDLRFWRSLARNELKKENAEALKKQPQQQEQQGWVSWLWGSKPEAKIEENEENTEMTEEQRKELYDAIDWDEKTVLAEAVDVPREAVKLCLEASLSTGSFTLKKSPHDNPVDLLSLHFDVFKAKALQRKDSLLANFSLGGLRVNDGTTPDSLYPEIVRVKDAPSAKRRRRMSLIELEKSDSDQGDPFFQFEVEKNPLERAGDIAVTAKMKPLEVVWNPNFVIGVADFFRPPERHMDSITALMETAGATVEGLREQTRAGLEFALEEHKTINAELDLQAPLIIIPVSITTEDSTCLIVDAGHIHVNSELVDQDTMKEIQSKQRQAYSDEDFKRLESAMYDKFLVKLTSTQVLIGPSIEETKAQLVEKDEESHLHVVDRINVDFVVETSILPKAPNLTKFKIHGHMPMLHAAVSDTKYKNLMKIIDVAVPKFGRPDQQQQQQQQQSAKEEEPSSPRLAADDSKKPRRKSGRERATSDAFPFMQPQTAVVLEDIDDDDDNFEDATDGTDNEQLKVQQRSFEFKFKVDSLKGSLYKSDPDRRKPDALLVELVAERFDLEFYTRPYDMAAEVSLGAVTVEDFVDNPSGDFKSIVSSGDSEDLQAGRSLVYVKFVKVNPHSPEFMPVYEGVETNVTAEVSTINLVVTRKTLLTLLDFILITFTSGNNDQPDNTKAITDSESDEDGSEETAVEASKPNTNAGSIRVKVELKSIRLILNNDGIRLATLSLNQADTGIFLRGRTMRISSKLGDLSLVDDVNLGVSEDSNLRKLVTIQGDDLADFRYETFDPTNSKAYPGYDSSIYLRAGSVKVNFVEEPFRKIVDFLVKFGKMQALYNAARQAAANQANQIQQSPNRIKFDIVVKTPIVVFPRLVVPGRPERDLITAYLGELYAQNKFAPIDDSEDADIAMKISTGIRNIRLTSDFHYPGDKSEELEMIDHVDLGFNITHAEHKPGVKRPDTEIEGSMSDFNLRLTQYQLKSLMAISKSVPAAFAGEGSGGDEEAARAVDQDTLKRARTLETQDNETLVDLAPELGSIDKAWTKLDLIFKVHTVGLELIMAKENEPVGDIASSSLSRFSLDETKVKTRLLSDGSMEAELLIHSFTIHDSRPRESNRFRRIMTSANKEAQQLMASVTMSGGKERSLIAMATIDSPRVIFALDYLFAIQKFAVEGLAENEPLIIDDEESIQETPDESDADSMQVTYSAPRSQRARSELSRRQSEDSRAVVQQEKEPEPSMSVAFRVNLVDAQVILIANPLVSNSEAIVLNIRQMLLSKQHALTFQVSQIGMFLCRMDKFETSRLRIIDDFSIQMSMDSSQPLSTNIHIEIEPLILRLSLRDILLAVQIISKAGELSGSEPKEPKETPAQQKARELRNAGMKQKSASGRGQTTLARSKGKSIAPAGGETRRQPPKGGSRHHEELSATVEGVRIVLIGDLHELPILDIGVKDFTATALNWSSNLKAEAAIDLYSNVYNFSKSSWEPLLEPWQVGLGVARDPISGLLSVDVASRKTFDVTITTASIALASKSFDFLTTEQDVLGKPRGHDAPYRIRNYTGFDVVVNSKSPTSEDPITARLEDGQEEPWSFEHWEKMRENLLTESHQNDISITLEGSGFDPVKNVRVNREGEFLYGLRPKTGQVAHRIWVDISLGSDNVKYVTLRSPLLVENATEIPVELGTYDPEDGNLLKIEKIAPGDARPAPVGAVYEKHVLIRPDAGFGYQWSRDHLSWRDMLKRPTKQVVCKGENGEPFYFQVHARFDRANPLTK